MPLLWLSWSLLENHMRQLYAPNGKKIVGTSDTVPVTSYVHGWESNGTPIYDDL